MKILLIHVHHDNQRFRAGLYKKHLRYAPLTMPTLATLIPVELGAEVTVIDEMIEEVDYNLRPDIVGITAITSAAPRAFEIARRFRQGGATVVLGGVHATLMPDECLQHADVVVRGYAERSWPRLLADLRAGRLQPIYEDTLGLEASCIVAPERRFIKHRHYVAHNTIEMSRGCTKTCDFCVAPRLHDEYVTRDIPDVIDEIRRMRGKLITFLDPNVIGNVDYAREFFKEVAKLKKYWLGCVSMDILQYPGLLDVLVKSGARGFLIGFESLQQEALDNINKLFNRTSEYAEAIKLFHRKGVMVQGSFVFGFESDDRNVFARTARFIIDNKIDLPQFTIFTPFPGTPAFEKLEAQGRILHHNWERYNGHEVVFSPKQMNAGELLEGFRKVWNEVYTLPNIMRRIAAPPYLLKSVALLSNLNFRRYMRRIHFED